MLGLDDVVPPANSKYEVEISDGDDWELITVRADSPREAVQVARHRAPVGWDVARGCTVTWHPPAEAWEADELVDDLPSREGLTGKEA